MKILKYLLLLVLIVFIGGAIYLATLDGNYDIQRSKVINAPIGLVYNKVNDYKAWETWSPWLYKDPNTKLTYGDITSGSGASYSWESENEEVGAGRMETVDAVANESLNQQITFIEPWEQQSDIYWTFKPAEGGGTEVTWGLKGEMPFMARYMAAKMDEYVSPDYEKGLAKLDSVIQLDMKKYSIKVDGETTHSGGYYLYNTTSCKIDEMPDKMAEMMPKVGAYAMNNKITMAGPAFSLYHKWDQENNAVIFSCAVPVVDRVITERDSGIQTGMLKPFKALKTTLTGNYDNLAEAWTMAEKYIADNNLVEINGHPALEVYANDPMEYPNPADWVTEIYIPIK
ncbi:MAG: transcription activator effector-binding protein [Flavobacteriaceae bacterium]|nr:transcription activator effector-binding protein [Flavobacteriaceae bacterium]